jgi:hypothetical protein
MTGKRALVAAAVAVLLAAPGCVSCGHHVCKPAREAGPDCPIPLRDRQQVYVVLVNGLTPGGPSGLEGLRDRLADQGFTKVYCGQLCHAVWLGQEMRRVHKEEPAARFIVVGYDLGGAAALRLAADARTDGLPVEALVLLDPMGKPKDAGCAVRTVLVCSGSGTSPFPHSESLSVPDAGHFSLPTHPQTVAVVCDLLGEVASRVEHPAVYDPDGTVYYEHAPPARPVPGPPPGGDEDWLFLHDQPGPHNTPLLPPDAGIPLTSGIVNPGAKSEATVSPNTGPVAKKAPSALDSLRGIR